MIDKAEQRRRAAEMSQTLAAQGQQAPKLTYPVTPKAAKPEPRIAQSIAQKRQTGVRPVKYDCAGKALQVGDKVATSVDGIVSVLTIGRIAGFTKDRVEVEVPVPSQNHGQLQTYRTILKYPTAIAKVS